MYDYMARALLCENLACSLDVQAVNSIPKSYDTTHGLAFARKWDHLDDVGGIACLLVVRPTEFLREFQQSGLCLVSDKHRRATLRIHALECGRVDGDRSVEQFH